MSWLVNLIAGIILSAQTLFGFGMLPDTSQVSVSLPMVHTSSTSTTRVQAHIQYPVAPVTKDGGYLAAIPLSGKAPLTVRFTASGLNNEGCRYNLVFGDPSGILYVDPSCASDAVSGVSSLSTVHTYTSAGTYTATLYYYTPDGEGLHKIAGNVTIIVTE